MTNTTVDSNNAGESGGGIFNEAGTDLLAESSTISYNTAIFGGGMQNAGTARLANMTISRNVAGAGGGISNQAGDLTITNGTINQNAGSGIETLAGSEPAETAAVSISNTIIAKNAPGDCTGPTTPISAGHNLTSDNSCSFIGPGDLNSTVLLLGLLADNGGPTKTQALFAGSPAIDGGDNADCPAADQRGQPRPTDGDLNGSAVCDIGAYEREGPLAATPSPSAMPVQITPSPTPAAIAPVQLPATGGEPGSARGLPERDLAALATVALMPVAIATAIVWRRRTRRRETQRHLSL